MPEPGAFEVIVRVMAAGVNFNNVWAALGKPVSVFGYGDHPEYGHHIGGSDASGVVWKVGEGVTRWKAGDEVVVHCNQASYEDPEVHGLDPMAAPSQKIWGYETTWGSFAQFTKVQAQQLLPKPQALAWEECRLLRPDVLHRLPHADQPRQAAGRAPRPDLGRRRRPRRVRRRSSCKAAGAECVGVVSSAEKGELVKQLGAVDYIDRNEFAGMMRRGGETPDEEKARFKVTRAFAKRVKEILGDSPDIVFEHVGKATFPTSVFTVKPFGKVVICGATSGFNLDFDVRYLWMRQKEILGSHFANAWECTKANELIDDGLIRPVLWRTMAFDQVAEAHQLMHENKHARQDLDPRRRDRGGPGQDRRRARARSTRRSAPDGRRHRSHPLVRDGLPRRQARGARCSTSARPRCATARPRGSSTAAATTATSCCRWSTFDVQGATSSAGGTARR